MATGLDTWDENGLPLISYTGRIARQFGEFSTGTSGGSVVIPELAQGVPWIASVPEGIAYISNSTRISYPAIFLSGTTITWQFFNRAAGLGESLVSCRVAYGVL